MTRSRSSESSYGLDYLTPWADAALRPRYPCSTENRICPWEFHCATTNDLRCSDFPPPDHTYYFVHPGFVVISTSFPPFRLLLPYHQLSAVPWPAIALYWPKTACENCRWHPRRLEFPGPDGFILDQRRPATRGNTRRPNSSGPPPPPPRWNPTANRQSQRPARP